MLAVSEIELVKPFAPLILTPSDTVEVLFQLCREVVVDQVGEPLLQQARDRERKPLRDERCSPANNIVSVDDDLNDGGVGRGSPNTFFLQCLDQAGLGVPGRRLGVVGFGFDIGDGDDIPHA